MKPTDKITSLKELEILANAYFPCKVTVDPVTKGFGERGDNRRLVRLIVGYKKNPSYSPEAKSGLASKLKVADTRTIAIYSGITVQEVVNEYLLKIKKSLNTKEPIIDEGVAIIQKSSKPQPTDDELAKSLEDGQPLIGEYLEDNENWTDENSSDWGENNTLSSESDKDFMKTDREIRNSDAIVEDTQIDILVNSVKIIADDLATVAKKIDNIETEQEKLSKKVKKLNKE